MKSKYATLTACILLMSPALGFASETQTTIEEDTRLDTYCRAKLDLPETGLLEGGLTISLYRECIREQKKLKENAAIGRSVEERTKQRALLGSQKKIDQLLNNASQRVLQRLQDSTQRFQNNALDIKESFAQQRANRRAEIRKKEVELSEQLHEEEDIRTDARLRCNFKKSADRLKCIRDYLNANTPGQ